MSLAVWAERDGVARATPCRWLHAGVLAVPGRKVGGLILVHEAASGVGPQPRAAVDARVWSADQGADLDGRVARVIAWVTAQQISVDKVVVEVGSALSGHRREFLALLREQTVRRVVVGHRDRFCRFGSEDVEAGLVAQCRELVVVGSAEVDDGVVRDVTEILTSMCARLCGQRAAPNRAERALAVAASEGVEAA